MGNIALNVYQALQLVALGPCIFVIFFLVLTVRSARTTIIPALYFLSLSCSFLLPLLPLLQSVYHAPQMQVALLIGQSLSYALAFLLIMQFLLGRTPPLVYWLILALPALGGGSMILGSLYAAQICIPGQICFNADEFKTLYSIIGSSIIFLLLVVNFYRKDTVISGNDPHRRHKYWMIMTLTLMHLSLLLIDLAWLADDISTDKLNLASSIIRLTFVYLALTSIFRVFDNAFALDMERIPTAARSLHRENDPQLVEAITQWLSEKKIYREMGLSREQFATKLATSEQNLSRLVNSYFKKSFTELLNEHRVEEAKQRLASEETPVTVIAFEVGFNSIASFNRVFKEMVGKSPTEYRQGKKA